MIWKRFRLQGNGNVYEAPTSACFRLTCIISIELTFEYALLHSKCVPLLTFCLFLFLSMEWTLFQFGFGCIFHISILQCQFFLCIAFLIFLQSTYFTSSRLVCFDTLREHKCSKMKENIFVQNIEIKSTLNWIQSVDVDGSWHYIQLEHAKSRLQ